MYSRTSPYSLRNSINALYNSVLTPRYFEALSKTPINTSLSSRHQSYQQRPQHQARHNMAGKRKFTTQIPAMGKRKKTAKVTKFFEEPEIIEKSNINWISPITYADIHYHQQVARIQNPLSNGPFLPGEVQRGLQDEWYSIIDGAFGILDSRLHCTACSDRHTYLVLWDVGQEVKREMESTEAENVKPHMIERWASRMKLIEDTYKFAMKGWHATGSTVKGKEVDLDLLTQEEIDKEFSLIAKSERERKANLEKERLEKEQRERQAAPRMLDFLPPVTPYSSSSRGKKPTLQQAQLVKGRRQNGEDGEVFQRDNYEALHSERRRIVSNDNLSIKNGQQSQSSSFQSSVQHAPPKSSISRFPGQQPPQQKPKALSPNHTEVDRLILDYLTPSSNVPADTPEITVEEVLAEESEDEGLWIENGGYASGSGSAESEDNNEDDDELERDLEIALEREEEEESEESEEE